MNAYETAKVANGGSISNPADALMVAPNIDGPPPASKPPKKSWAECLPLCPSCGEPMQREKKGWRCVIHEEKDKSPRGCGGTNTDGNWRVEFFPTIPTLNKKGRERLNQLTLETWENQPAAKIRVGELQNHFQGALVVPQQPTWLSAEQCRAAEQFFLHKKNSIQKLEFSERLLEAVDKSALKSADELVDFIYAHSTCGIQCSPMGMVEYCKVTKWPGNLLSRPTFIEAVQKVLKHKMGGFGGGRPISEAQVSKSKSQNAYIMAYFQPNYPEPTYPDAFTDEAILRFCTYSYDTPRKGMPLTEMEKWREACTKAEREGCPLPSKPVEEAVYKLVEDGTDAHGVLKFKKVAGALDYDRPWPRTVANSFLVACRAIKNAMARETLCGEPAKWTQPGGESLTKFSGTAEELAAEAMVRAKEHRVLTTEEKVRILNASLAIDGGVGAPSVLWQGWGGGRRADVERYCKDNLCRVNGRIQAYRWQTKNGSCKDVTPMLNFYYMADFLIQLGLWTEENFEHGFSETTRIRILARAGFWEESWEMVLSVADSRAGEDFGYQPFDNDDIIDLPRFVNLLREHSTPGSAFVWHGFSETDKQTLSNYRPRDKAQDVVRTMIVQRLNTLMYGPDFHSDAIFNGVKLRKRTIDLLQRNPTGPNRGYLLRLLLEDIFKDDLARRQGYPPNALRRSGMSALYQVYESKDATITYFSTGGTSWEESYKTFYSKKAAREHWQCLYSCMDKMYSEQDRKELLPPGHKLDDFRTSEVIESEQKNKLLAEEYKQTTPPPVPRQPSGNQYRAKYTLEEKSKYVEEFKKSGTTQKAFAEEHDLSPGVFHRWLDLAGGTQKVRSKEEIEVLIAKYQASGLGKEAFAESVRIPYRTFWAYLEKAGLTDEGPKRHTPKEMAQHVAQFKATGMTKQDYADSIGVDRTSLSNWIAAADAARDAADNCQVPEPSDVLAQRKFSDEQVAALIAEYLAAPVEVTQEAFAKAKGIGLKTFHVWLTAAGKTTPRRSKEEIVDYVARFRKNDMTHYAFAESIGVAAETLYRWLKD